MSRPSWSQYFMDMAKQAATRATCPRKHVGAVIVRDKTVLATGFNGSVRGLPHCEDIGCLMEDSHCVRVVHAEMNAIIQAAKHGVRIEASSIYVTASPCWPCFKGIANAGIKTIVFDEFYRDDRIFDLAEKLGIDIMQLREGDLTKEFKK